MSAIEPKLSFEEALTKLEEIVAQLEGGGLPLEQALEQFEQAMRLKKQCEKQLARAEAKIEELAEAEERRDPESDDQPEVRA